MSLEQPAPAAAPPLPPPSFVSSTAGAPEPRPLEPPAGEPDGEPDGDGVSGTVQKSEIRDTHVGRDLSVDHSIHNYLSTQRRAPPRQFSFAAGREVKEIEEKRTEEHFVGVEGEAEALVRHLEESRVLLLSGEAGARKVTAAIHLAVRLRRRDPDARAPFLFEPLDRHLRVDFRGMPAKHDQFQDRVVIFRSPLSRGNLDLAHAFGSTDRAGWTHLADCLRERNAYLVCTATPAEIEPFRNVHALQDVHRALVPHTREVLDRCLDEYLDTLRQYGGAAVAESLAALDGLREPLLRHFSFRPQLTAFADFFVRRAEPSLGFDEVHALFQDTHKRLLHELDDDFDGWSFGFTLALAQCTPDAHGVPWVDFDRLRRHLRRWLRRDMQLAGGPAEGDPDPESSEVRLELSDDPLLTRSRARVEKDPATHADVVRFCDGRPPQGLWRALLEHHRRVLTAILPRLRELAEQPDQVGVSLSVLAAQIIGRIGEIDYERVVVPIADRWTTLAGGRFRGLVGAMFDGVLGSDEPRLHARCHQHLRTMHATGGTRFGPDRVETAVAAYAWVGCYDFRLAMRELYRIVEAELVPMIEDAPRIAQLSTRIQHDLERTAGKGTYQAKRGVRDAMRNLVDQVYAGRGGIHRCMQLTLASLCATHGVAHVLKELRRCWIGRGGETTGVMVALMFLHEHGIADQLHDDRVELPRGDNLAPATCGLFVRALTNSDEAVHQAAGFLGDLDDSVTTRWATEWLLRRHFRERLETHLLQWAREAAPFPELAAPMRGLMEQLSRTPGGRMREIVAHLVRGEFTRHPELTAFVASLRL
jgi:hypothetical protein